MESASRRLKALPLQLLKIENGVVLKRGSVELKIGGENAADIVRIVLSSTANGGATREEILEYFESSSHSAVENLIDQLIAVRMLANSETMASSDEREESNLDIFYWHFEEKTANVTERLNNCRLMIIGVNHISRQIASALIASGVTNFLVSDDPLLRNLRLFDDTGRLRKEEWSPLVTPQESTADLDPTLARCVVATSDCGDHRTMQRWNRHCIENKINFLPVVLHNLVGYIGPFVVPDETACLECLHARQNSHLEDPTTTRAIQDGAGDGQNIIGFHPSMASVLGDIAVLELTKFYGGLLPFRKVGMLIEVDLLETRLKARKVLKVPRCQVCSPLKTRPSTLPTKGIFFSNHGDQ